MKVYLSYFLIIVRSIAHSADYVWKQKQEPLGIPASMILPNHEPLRFVSLPSVARYPRGRCKDTNYFPIFHY